MPGPGGADSEEPTRPQEEETRRKADEEEEILPEEVTPLTRRGTIVGQEQKRRNDDEELPETEVAEKTKDEGNDVTWVNGFPVRVDKNLTEENGESAVAKLTTKNKKQSNSIRDMAKKGEGMIQNAVNRVRANSGMKPTTDTLPTDTSDLTKYRVRIVALFREYAPDRVRSTDRLLSANVGQEEECIAKLVAELGSEPPPGPSPFQARYIRLHNHYGKTLVKMREQLDDYAGKEEELMNILVSQLGPEPTDDQNIDPALRRRLVRFYEKWNPAKIAMVDDVLARLASREEELFVKLVAKYGSEPDPEEVINVQKVRPRAKSERFVDPLPLLPINNSRRATLQGPPAIDPLSPLNSSFSKSYSPTKKRLMRFYLHYNPDKISSVNTMLETYRGEERIELLFKKLVLKYGPEPEAGDEDDLRVDDDTRRDYSACLMDNMSPKKSLRRFDSYSSSCGSNNLRDSSQSASPVRKARPVRGSVISDAAKVRKMLSGNSKFPTWDADYESWIGQRCTVVKENLVDHTVAVVFKNGKGGWFPKAAIILDDNRRSSIPETDQTKTTTTSSHQQVESEGEDDSDAVTTKAAIAAAATAQSSDATEEGFPSQFAISSLTFAQECSGQYNILEETVNGYPVWSRVRSDAEDIEAYLFSTPTGEWRVSDDREDFDTGAGYFNTDTHNGKKPHELRTWFGEDDDVPDKNISCKAIDHSKGDRIEGGHLIVGRVVAELSEEELQYASFQRRKKFRKKEAISAKCEICVRFDSICSSCYVSRIKAQQERRKYLKTHFKEWDLRKRVGVFFAAVAAGEDEDVKLMLETGGADPNWMAFFKKKSTEHNSLPADGSHISPLHAACAYQQPDVVKVLVTAGARYCRDQHQMLPLDYVVDEDASHDIVMYLSECTPDYNITLQVMEVWDLYHDGDYTEARDAFFDLVLKYPDRDTCHLGLVYCHLALGDIERCLSTSTTTLQSTSIRWVECQKVAIQKAMERANELKHEIAHEEPTIGCIKSCGCVIYPKGWIIPLKSLRKMNFSVIKNIFSYLPCSTAWSTWIALYKSELLRKTVDAHVTEASRRDPRDALKIFTTVPAWLASYKEAVTDRVFEGWNTHRYGNLAHVVVEGIECESIITFPYFVTRVTCVQTHVSNTTLTKFKKWFSKDQRVKPTPRQRVSAANIKAIDDGEHVVTFSLVLKDPTDSIGVDYKVTVCITFLFFIIIFVVSF